MLFLYVAGCLNVLRETVWTYRGESHPALSESLGVMHERWRNKQMVRGGKKEERKRIDDNWKGHLEGY